MSVQNKISEIKPYPLCLGNTLKDFFVNYNFIDNSNIINIHKYLMKKHDIK